MLHEALTGRADPLHLALMFGISRTTASKYTLIACNLLPDQPADAAGEQHHAPDEPGSATAEQWLTMRTDLGRPAGGSTIGQP